MLRSARMDIPGVPHHAMIRGLKPRKVFRDDEDRDYFLKPQPPIPLSLMDWYVWEIISPIMPTFSLIRVN
jgi:putative transposase